MNEIVPRTTLVQIEQRRNSAIEEYRVAHQMITSGNEALQKASDTLRSAAPSAHGYMMEQHERDKVFGSLDIAKEEEFNKIARHMVDADVWSSLIHTTDLQMLMDKEAKDELRQSLITDPPEFTVENARATLQHFANESGMIFRRGIAKAFSNLDRRFRSHSGWKIGSRVILERALDENGWWSHYSNKKDTLQDIERTFFILDGRKPPASYAGIIGEIDNSRRGLMAKPARSEVESEFYTIRIFKNGNLHIWFKRADLVQKANKMIGEYYGEVIPEERTYDDEEDVLNTPKFTPAKNHGFFPTPDALAKATIEDAKIWKPETPLKILEPSAGTGQLSSKAVEFGNIVDCIELQSNHAVSLSGSGLYRKVFNADFLSINPGSTGLYDRVIMNPPFDRERDIDHVMHALKFLKEDGFLIAIMSAHTEFAESKKATQFRKHISKMGGKFRDNPRNSFSSVGTNVNTITLRVYKNGKTFY